MPGSQSKRRKRISSQLHQRGGHYLTAALPSRQNNARMYHRAYPSPPQDDSLLPFTSPMQTEYYNVLHLGKLKQTIKERFAAENHPSMSCCLSIFLSPATVCLEFHTLGSKPLLHCIQENKAYPKQNLSSTLWRSFFPATPFVSPVRDLCVSHTCNQAVWK